MRRKYVIIALITLIVLSLQAKGKTLDEQLAGARKNSEIFLKKAGAFQESFGKDEAQPILKAKKIKRPQMSTKKHKTINFTQIDVIKINEKRRYCDINIDLETTSSKKDTITLLLEAIISLNLPMDKGFYMYRGEQDIPKKLLYYLKSKSDTKSIHVNKLILQ